MPQRSAPSLTSHDLTLPDGKGAVLLSLLRMPRNYSCAYEVLSFPPWQGFALPLSTLEGRYPWVSNDEGLNMTMSISMVSFGLFVHPSLY
jgi:hypothetical protein